MELIELVDANFESHFELKRNKSPKTKLLAKKWTPLSFTQTFSHSHFKKKKLISTSNANFLRKKKNQKTRNTLEKILKLI